MNILLIHGLGRSPLSMLSLSVHLKQSGYQPQWFGYAAFAESYDRIVDRLTARLGELSTQGPYAIVAHSLGGILTRSALGGPEMVQPQHVVMLGTPNQPPRLAQMVWPFLPFQWFSGTCGANLASSTFYAQLPHLQSSYTIIAGTSGPRGPWSPFGMEINDGLVALSETSLSQTDQRIECPGIHGWMMNQPAVQATIVQVLRQSAIPHSSQTIAVNPE